MKPTKSRSEEADVYTYQGVGQGWGLVYLTRSWTEVDGPTRKQVKGCRLMKIPGCRSGAGDWCTYQEVGQGLKTSAPSQELEAGASIQGQEAGVPTRKQVRGWRLLRNGDWCTFQEVGQGLKAGVPSQGLEPGIATPGLEAGVPSRKQAWGQSLEYSPGSRRGAGGVL